MLEEKLNKPGRSQKNSEQMQFKYQQPLQIKKLAELKLKDLTTTEENPILKPSVPRTVKVRAILIIHKGSLKIRFIINTQNLPTFKIAKKISKKLRRKKW